MYRENGETTSQTQKWYEEYPKASEPSKNTRVKSELEIMELKEEGKKCLETESAAFQLKQSKSHDSELSWLRTALTKGTTSDKVAASIVMIQSKPKYNLSRLASLIAQVKTSKHNQYNLVIDSLKDLFLSDLLHPRYKLLKFEEQDFAKLEELENSKFRKKQVLALWYFEDQLKEHYERFVASLSTVASDTVDSNRKLAVSTMNELLMGNGEQEHKLLEFIVNKIGDPSPKVASKAVFCLNRLLREHPNMKLVVLREVEKLLFRKNVAPRAQYYSTCLLAQFVLDKDDVEVANHLIDVYFAFFKASLKKGEPDTKMMAAILTGVNRAYPFSKSDSGALFEHIDSIYKVVHVGSFSVALNALSLLHQVVGRNLNQADRFYSAFYRKMFDPQIAVSNKRAVFLNLLFRVLKNDHSIVRLRSFIKRVLQVSLYFPANMICATLYVISKVLQFRKDAKYIFRNSAAKRKNAESSKSEGEKEDREEEEKQPNEQNIDLMLPNVKIDEEIDLKVEETKEEIDNDKEYDPFCRNPVFACGKSINEELYALSAHFHPTVSLFANTILEGKPIIYTGDPLEDLNLIRFLDRFAFKNPKKLGEKKVTKKNDPLAHRAAYTPRGVKSMAVDSAAYVNESETRIPVDELFLYKYLKRRSESRGTEKPPEDEDDDNESVNSEEFNEMMDNFNKDQDLDELDVAADLGSMKMKKKGKNADLEDEDGDEDSDISLEDGIDEDDDDDDEEDEDEADEEEMGNFKSKKQIGKANKGFDEFDDFEEDNDDFEDMDDDFSDMDFNDEEESEEETQSRGKRSTGKKKSKKNFGKFDDSVFVSAEEFSAMLEEQGRKKGKHGGSNDLSNFDNANAKQLNWELKRNEKIRGIPEHKKRKGAKRNFHKKFNDKNAKRIKR